MWNNGVFTVPKSGNYTMNGVNLALMQGDIVRLNTLFIIVNGTKRYSQFNLDNMRWHNLNTHWLTEGNKILNE